MRMNDRLQQLALFVRTVETGSFSRAAREFGLTRPSASRAVVALEERRCGRFGLFATYEQWSLFARNRRAVVSVTRCELTFRRKLILRKSTTALRWKKGEGLPIQPGQSNDGAETATTREVERDNLVLSGAAEMTVGAKAQPTRPSKLGNV
jgi:Bacterial regulatory helix-turn-helix protein, lysR family